MNQFRLRLTFIFILLIGSSVLVAGIFMANMFQQSHIEALKEYMVRELKIISATIDWEASRPIEEQREYYSNIAKKLRESADARLTFLRSDGEVLGDSDARASLMDNHMLREEVYEASVNGIGYSIRFSETLQRNMMYVAVRLDDQQTGGGYIRLATSLSQVETSIRNVWIGLLLGLLALFVISGLISYRIALSMTKPIERITLVAQQITNRNYKSRAPAHQKDEIGQLGLAINRMSDSLQKQMERISENENRLSSIMSNMVSGVVMIDGDERIALMNRASEELLGFSSKELLGSKYNDANQQLEFTQMIEDCIERRERIREEIVFYFPQERILEVNITPLVTGAEDFGGVLVVLHDITAIRKLEKMRSEFVANVSHELKTPIAAIKGFSETILAGALQDQETTRSFVQIIYDESERLNRLIGDILDLSKIESKRSPLSFSPVHMLSFVDNCLHVMNSEAMKKSIELEMQVPDSLYMEADEDRLGQILFNLLANGINYTQEGGKVRVKVFSYASGNDGLEPDRVSIQVSDTGIGIPRKDLPRIFERFYRVDKARSRSSGGTGLGLSIVKHLVELHRGTIQVESEPGMGTTFIIDLPMLHA